MAYHYILCHIHFMEEVISVFRAFDVYIILIRYSVDSHSGKGLYALLSAKVQPKSLPDGGEGSPLRLLEVIWNCDFPAIGSILVESHLYRKNLKAHIAQVTGKDIHGKKQVVEDRSRDFDEEFAVSNLHSTDSCAVDDRWEGKGLSLVIIEIWELIIGGDDISIFLSLWMLLADFPQGKLLIHSKWNEGCSVWIHSCVMHRIVYEIGAIDSHGDGLSLPSEVEAELLLALDQVRQKVIVNLNPTAGKTDGVVSDADGRLMVNDHPSFAILLIILCGEEVIVWNLSAFICGESPCNSSRGPEVRTVGIVKLDLQDSVLFVVTVKLSLGHREDIDKLLICHFLTKKLEEEFFRCINLWH